jgi:hypothetical protein
MRTPLLKIGLLGSLLGVGIMLAGCNKAAENADASTAKPPSPRAEVNTGAKAPGRGGVPDMDVYPAPSGVKTGIEGGRK